MKPKNNKIIQLGEKLILSPIVALTLVCMIFFVQESLSEEVITEENISIEDVNKRYKQTVDEYTQAREELETYIKQQYKSYEGREDASKMREEFAQEVKEKRAQLEASFEEKIDALKEQKENLQKLNESKGTTSQQYEKALKYHKNRVQMEKIRRFKEKTSKQDPKLKQDIEQRRKEKSKLLKSHTKSTPPKKVNLPKVGITNQRNPFGGTSKGSGYGN